MRIAKLIYNISSVIVFMTAVAAGVVGFGSIPFVCYKIGGPVMMWQAIGLEVIAVICVFAHGIHTKGPPS